MKRKQNRVQDARSFFANKKGDSNYMRPFIAKDGNAYVMVHTGGDKDDIKNYRRELVNNATLRYDEWRTLDQKVIKIAEQRLVGFEDLRRNGLTMPLGNAMGTTVLTWNEMSDAMEATISMDPVRRGKNDRPDFGTNHIPIPVIHADYQISERVLIESRNKGTGLDTLSAERAARRVSEKMEDMLFGENSILTYGGGTIQTYFSHPDRNIISLGNAWDDTSKTPDQIIADVLAMKQASLNDKYYGPWMLYIPTGYDTVMDDDYKSTSAGMSQTIRERILKINGIQDVKVVDRMPANKVLLVTMQSDVVDLIDGMPIQNVQWDTEGGFIHNFKVMAIQVPRVKSDYNGASGIVVLQ